MQSLALMTCFIENVSRDKSAVQWCIKGYSSTDWHADILIFRHTWHFIVLVGAQKGYYYITFSVWYLQYFNDK